MVVGREAWFSAITNYNRKMLLNHEDFLPGRESFETSIDAWSEEAGNKVKVNCRIINGAQSMRGKAEMSSHFPAALRRSNVVDEFDFETC